MPDRARLGANLDAVRFRIAAACARSGRDPDGVTLVAVTKTVDAATVRALYELGVRDAGENRAAEGAAKVTELRDELPGLRWHFIGHVQRRKVGQILPCFLRIHSLDSERLAVALDRAAGERGEKIEVWIEVKESGEESKSGVSEAEAALLAGIVQSLSHLSLRGLMTLAPYVPAEETRPCFARLRALRDRLRIETGAELPGLSMGMSNDFEVAVEEGATHIRVGSALFEGAV